MENVFRLHKPLDDETFELLNGLAKTRRMKRDASILSRATQQINLGVDGEFYFNPLDFENDGQLMDGSIVDYNSPPGCQPSLWLHWHPSEDRRYITWKGDRFIENSVEWIAYLISKILMPRDYILNGAVRFSSLLNLVIENNELYKNNQYIDKDELLINMMISRMQVNGNSGLKAKRVLKMEMSPNGKRAIELEENNAEINILLSAVEKQFSFRETSRAVLLHCFTALEPKDIRTEWSNDSLRASIYFWDLLVSVYDLNTNQMLTFTQIDSSGAIVPLSSCYADYGIEAGKGIPILQTIEIRIGSGR